MRAETICHIRTDFWRSLLHSTYCRGFNEPKWVTGRTRTRKGFSPGFLTDVYLWYRTRERRRRGTGDTVVLGSMPVILGSVQEEIPLLGSIVAA